MTWGSEDFTRKAKSKTCHWCGARSHKTEECKVDAEKLARRERIAERQARTWAPRTIR